KGPLRRRLRAPGRRRCSAAQFSSAPCARLLPAYFADIPRDVVVAVVRLTGLLGALGHRGGDVQLFILVSYVPPCAMHMVAALRRILPLLAQPTDVRPRHPRSHGSGNVTRSV